MFRQQKYLYLFIVIGVCITRSLTSCTATFYGSYMLTCKVGTSAVYKSNFSWMPSLLTPPMVRVRAAFLNRGPMEGWRTWQVVMGQKRLRTTGLGNWAGMELNLGLLMWGWGHLQFVCCDLFNTWTEVVTFQLVVTWHVVRQPIIHQVLPCLLASLVFSCIPELKSARCIKNPSMLWFMHICFKKTI